MVLGRVPLRTRNLSSGFVGFALARRSRWGPGSGLGLVSAVLPPSSFVDAGLGLEESSFLSLDSLRPGQQQQTWVLLVRTGF